MQIKSNEILKVLNSIKPILGQKIDTALNSKNALLVGYKGDKSLVTEIDLYISNLFKHEFLKAFPHVNFYSEEDQALYKFPLVILDPVDGTKELVAGRPEWVISFGLYQNEKINSIENFSWIFNPITQFEISSEQLIHLGDRPKVATDDIMVSRSEFTAGDNTKYKECFNLLPMGSIAYKLGLLASGAGKMVFSKRDKNIWDILAGTHICMKNNIYCYQNGIKLEKISSDLLHKDFIWCHENNLDQYRFIFENEFDT